MLSSQSTSRHLKQGCKLTSLIQLFAIHGLFGLENSPNHILFAVPFQARPFTFSYPYLSCVNNKNTLVKWLSLPHSINQSEHASGREVS
jgi:hypothetical protein